MLERRLPNGLRILCEQVSTAPVVAIQAWVGVGSADELPREAGLAHLHEHMLFKGTARRGVGEIAQEIEAAGGEVNAWTSFDETVYHITMTSRFFAAGLDVLSDAILHSSFDAGELSREREVVLEEIRRGLDQPGRRLSQRLFSTAFRRHPYGRPVIGYPKTVAHFTRSEILSFYKKWYVPNNVVFVVVGDVDEERAARAVAGAFGKAKARDLRRPRRAAEPAPTRPRAFAEVADTGDAYAALAFPIPGSRHPDAPGLDVLADVLGGGEASRLFERVQAELGLVSSVYAHAYTPKDPGLFSVGANPFTGKELAAAQALWSEIERLRDGGAAAAELDRSKLSIEADSVYLRETVQGRARKWGYSLLEMEDAQFEEKYLDAVRRLTVADLSRLAGQYLRPERASAGLIVPGSEKGPAAKKAARSVAAGLERVFRKAPARSPAKAPGLQRKPTASLHVLANGCRVVFERASTIPAAAFKAVWLGGSRFESPPEAGIYHFVAEMLARGAGGQSATGIRREAEAIAGSVQGAAGRNSGGVDAHCLSRFWERGFALFRDVALSPQFPEDEVEKARAETLAALDRENDSLSQVLFTRLRRTLYGAHPYGYRLSGEKESVQGFEAGALRSAHERLLDPARLVLSVVGELDAEALLPKLEESFGRLPARGEAPPRLSVAPLAGRLYSEQVMDRAQAHLAVGVHATTLDDPGRFALEVLNALLSGQGGRLFMNLRDKMSLAYSVGSLVVEGIEPGLLAAYIGTAPEKLSTAFAAMMRELEKMRDLGPGAAEIRRAKRHLAASHAIDQQGYDSRASLYALSELYGLGYRSGEEYARRIEAVEVADLRAAAGRYLTMDRAVLCVVRPSRTPSLESAWLGAPSLPAAHGSASARRVARGRA